MCIYIYIYIWYIQLNSTHIALLLMGVTSLKTSKGVQIPLKVEASRCPFWMDPRGTNAHGTGP